MTNAMVPQLNWRELAQWIRLLKPELVGKFVDRVFIPERTRFAESYLKGEWGLKLTSRQSEGTLIFSIRNRVPYLYWLDQDSRVKSATQATHSAFDLALGKYIKGSKVRDVVALPKERVVVIWFEDPENKYGLVMSLIPAMPEALLVLDEGQDTWKILARSRMINESKNPGAVLQSYSPPDGSKAPMDLPIRSALIESLESWKKCVQESLDQEAFEQRLKRAQQVLNELAKTAKKRLTQSKTALKEAQAEKDWLKYGNLLKASMSQNPPLLKNGTRLVQDYETDQEIAIPCDPKLNLSQQVEKFYSLAKRKQRRIDEAQSRVQSFKEALQELEHKLASPPIYPNWEELEALERVAQIEPQTTTAPKSGKAATSAWLGKSFTSQEGLTIWVGRSKDENLELTFKHARGNDLWLHVRGKPGAHVVIPLRSKKSAALETLLDAATLAVYYSGGEKWGKTEVDYTHKKYVKRIKDSTEASYTHNKTLIVAPDAKRLQRLQKS